MSDTNRALGGLKVIDLTQFESGTSCTQLLAWLGAEVIKVEPPQRGEQGRYSSARVPGADSFYFLMLNANKKSITADLKTEEGLNLLKSLLKDADVLIENFAPGTIERLGLDWETVTAINPRLIFAQIKGFHQDGPMAGYLAFDAVAQAMGGAVSITGEKDGRPLKAGMNVADSGAGLHCAVGILAAVYQRVSTGRGQHVHVTMQDAIINLSRIAYAAQAMFDKPAARSGNQSLIAGTSPSEVYPCAGGGPNDYCYIYTSRANSHQWLRLLSVIGREDLAEDPRFANPIARFDNHQEVDAIVSGWTRQYDKHQVMQMMAKAGVPAGAVLDTMELSQDAHLREKQSFVKLEHPVLGEYVMPGCPIRLSESPVTITPAPQLGEHDGAFRSTGRLG